MVQTQPSGPTPRAVVAIVIILATNFWGLVITFSDSLSPSIAHWTAYIIASHLPSAFVAGALLGRRWWRGALVGVIATLMLLGYSLLPSAAALALTVAAAAYAGGRTATAIAASRRI